MIRRPLQRLFTGLSSCHFRFAQFEDACERLRPELEVFGEVSAILPHLTALTDLNLEHCMRFTDRHVILRFTCRFG